MKHKFIKWVIEISPANTEVFSASSILKTRSEEFGSFITGMITMIEAKGYLLNEEGCHKSNRRNSLSRYYEFIKFTDDLELELVVEIRISDHVLPNKVKNGKLLSGDARRAKYLNEKRMPELAKEFDSEFIPVSVPVNIVFDQHHFTSYFKALKHINRLVNFVLE